MDKEVLLSVRNLQQYFKMGPRELKAVDNVSFDIYKGEVFGLVGESGCGKTTTGRSIIRLYDITGGSVYYKGERICAGIRSYKDAIAKARKDFADKKISKEERDRIIAENRAEIKKANADHHKWSRSKGGNQLTNEIQMIFQDPIASLDPRMTVRDIIAEGLVIRGIKDKEYIDQQVYKILETVGLVQEHATRYPHEFSGGQRQRIGIARAVIMNPELIIADEPISALDVSIQAQVINMFDELQEQMNLTYLFIAHDLLVVRHISDRIAVMYLGRMVELADAHEIYDRPLHPYTRSLMSAVPVPDPKIARENKRIILSGDIPSPLNAPSGCPFRTRCPHATEACAQSMPEFKEVATGHFVACHNLDKI